MAMVRAIAAWSTVRRRVVAAFLLGWVVLVIVGAGRAPAAGQSIVVPDLGNVFLAALGVYAVLAFVMLLYLRPRSWAARIPSPRLTLPELGEWPASPTRRVRSSWPTSWSSKAKQPDLSEDVGGSAGSNAGRAPPEGVEPSVGSVCKAPWVKMMTLCPAGPVSHQACGYMVQQLRFGSSSSVRDRLLSTLLG